MLQTSSSSSLSVRPLASIERPLVLVVDPDRSARAVLEVALSRDGFDVWSVETAEQGLGVLRRGRTPDVIVLEADLRGGDGFSFCAELRGNHKTARVPVVLLAKAGDSDAANLAEVVGVDECVQKPAFARDVAALVRFELVRHRGMTGKALRFHSKTLPAAHLLRALLTSARSGTFSLADGGAAMSFRDGSIVQAQYGERWGIDAVVRSLALTSHEYSVSLDPISVSTGFHCSLRDFVAQVLPRLARWKMLTMRSLPLDAVLAVDFARLAQALPSMPDEVNRIVQLFDGRRRVQQVLVDSAFDEVLTLEVGTRLYLMGVIGPVTAQTESLEPRQAPRLFEPRSAEAEHLMRQLFDGVAEIRSDDVEPAPVAESDWAMVGALSDLDVDDPAGGWTATALPDTHLLEGLEDDLAKKLSAFNVPTIVEPQESPPAHAPVVGFAHGAVEVEIESLEAALRNATGDDEAALAEFRSEPGDDAPTPSVLQPSEVVDQDPTPPSAPRRGADRQDRIITPVLTRAVSVEPLPLAEATHALTPEGAVVSTTAAQVATIGFPRPVVMGAGKLTAPALITVKVVKDDPEALFFAGDSTEADATAFEDTLPAHASPAKKQGRVGLLIGLALAAVVVAVGFEWLLNAAPSLPEAPMLAALTAPTPLVEAPIVAPLAPVAVEEVAVPEVVDVSEPLADGVRAYQRGEYQKAVSVLEQVVADEPGSEQGWLVLGQARYDLGDATGARAATVQVLEIDPRNAKVHVLLATIAHDANDKTAMRAELEKYLELDPNGEHAAEARALLAGR